MIRIERVEQNKSIFIDFYGEPRFHSEHHRCSRL